MLIARGDGLVQRWKDISTDLSYVLKYPLIASYDEPKVKEFMGLVTDYRYSRKDTIPAGVKDVTQHPMFSLVNKLEVSLDALLHEAKISSLRSYSPEERKKLKLAQQLFELAKDDGATPAERSGAYKRLRVLMDELAIITSDDLEQRLQIEMKEVLAITR